MHEFLCTCKAVCVHITCTIITVYAICEGLHASSATFTLFWLEVKITPNSLRLPEIFINTLTFHFLKFSFTQFLAILQNFCAWWWWWWGGSVGYHWNFLLLSAFLSPNFQPLNGSNFWNTCPIWIINPSLESYYVAVFKYYAFDHLSCDIFADISSFSSISEKICHVASFIPIQPHLMFLVYLLTTNGLSVCGSLKMLKY